MRLAIKCTDCNRRIVIEVGHKPAKGAVVKRLCGTCRWRVEEAIMRLGRQEAIRRRESEGGE